MNRVANHDTLFEVGAAAIADTNNECYTPPWIFTAAALTFDIDVAAPADPARRTCPAAAYYTAADDGLALPWHGLVWMNPPYANCAAWVGRWAGHPAGLALLPALKEVRWLGVLLEAAEAVTLISTDFGSPGGRARSMPFPLILAARGGAAVAGLARVAAADKYARGAFHVKPPAGVASGFV